jgi:probable phosphoglycerate mutase
MERLRARFSGIHFDAVYSSDLSRASTTATAISEPRGLSVITTKMLREVCLGEWEDTAWGDIEHLYSEMNHKFGNDPVNWSVKKGEPYENVKARMSNFITETAKNHDGETIAFFSHGFAIRALMCHLEGIASHETDKIPYFDNTAVTHLIYDNGDIKIESAGDSSHLSKEFSTLENQTWWRAEIRAHTENLRFMPLNEVCSENLLKIFRAKAGERAYVDIQYAAYLVDEPIGIVGIETKRDKRANVGWISYIHVIPKHRLKSFATQLLGLAISDFRKLRREAIRIELPSGSMGINFMSKYGFVPIDVTDEKCVMVKDIRNW